MANVRYLIKLTIAYSIRFKGIILIGIIIGLIFFFASTILFPMMFKNSTQRIGLTGRYHVDELPNFILEMVGDGLTKLSDNGTPEPNLASSWETPDKGKTWTFYLDPEKLWQDETNLTSESIIYEFSDVTIERLDARTISFKLKDPFSPFPSVVSKPTFKKGLLGTGEWKLDKLSISGNYVSEILISSKGKNKILYKFYPTTDRTKLALKLGQVDKIIDILDPSPFDTWKTSVIEANPNTNQVVTIFFNTKDQLVGEKAFRQALTYAIDKERFGTRAISSISPSSWAYNPQVKPYTYDTDRAKELVDDLPDELKNNLEVRLVSTPVLLSTAEDVADYWQEIGVKTVLQVSSIIPTDFQAYLTILDIPKDPDQYPLWHTTQTETNISKYTSFRIDKLLEDGRSELDPEERRKIYLDFQRFLLEDAPAAFLYHPTYYTISRR